MGWFGRKRRSESRIEGPHAVEYSQKPNLPQGTVQHPPPGKFRHTHHRRHQSAGMKILDVGKELSDSSPVGTVSSGEKAQELHPHKISYFNRSSREDITALPGSRELNTSP